MKVEIRTIRDITLAYPIIDIKHFLLKFNTLDIPTWGAKWSKGECEHQPRINYELNDGEVMFSFDHEAIIDVCITTQRYKACSQAYMDTCIKKLATILKDREGIEIRYGTPVDTLNYRYMFFVCEPENERAIEFDVPKVKQAMVHASVIDAATEVKIPGQVPFELAKGFWVFTERFGVAYTKDAKMFDTLFEHAKNVLAHYMVLIGAELPMVDEIDN
jgi:hypothetical protein